VGKWGLCGCQCSKVRPFSNSVINISITVLSEYGSRKTLDQNREIYSRGWI
jgi:hypothetical protein